MCSLWLQKTEKIDSHKKVHRVFSFSPYQNIARHHERVTILIPAFAFGSLIHFAFADVD